ncbi:SDR family NAD(P)-dependent oxidoreductase [Halopseudomonas sp.]|uniref:SDR family NAD(P)-dependent oxidoreductase n=1 Tax=Halopseudomonas sp. TaxID=2901191 RepID=UPI0035698241
MIRIPIPATAPVRLALGLWLALAVGGLSMFAAAAHADDHSEPRQYENQVAIITGSSHGLGYELARLGAEKGMKLVLVDMRREESEKLAEQIRSEEGHAIVVEADLAHAEQRPKIIEAAMEEFGRIDYLFNNAGYSYLATLEQMDIEQAHRLFEVNYWAYADLAQRVIPIMREQGGGTIVNVSSILGMRPAPPGLGHYAATKHALHGLFQTVAQEVEEDNIQVFLAAPGGMKTKISQHSIGPMADPESDRAADWEDPAIVAKDIFEHMQGDEVVFNPGYVGRQ